MFVVTVFGNDEPATKAANLTPEPQLPAAQPKPKKGAIEPGAREAAGKFILTAVARKDLRASWAVTHPELKAGYTLAQWTKGDLPVVPFPVTAIEEARFRVDESYKDEVMLEVALIPKPGSEYEATVFQIGLKATGTGAKRRWLVNYWMPRWGPRVPTDMQ